MNLYDNVSDTKALLGMLYGMNPKSVVSYPASAKIQFGKGVFLKDGKISNAKDDNSVFVGVALRHQCEKGEYLAKDTVAVLEYGSIWVEVSRDGTPTEGANAYVMQDGKFTTESSFGELVGKFKSEATEDDLALVEISK